MQIIKLQKKITIWLMLSMVFINATKLNNSQKPKAEKPKQVKQDTVQKTLTFHNVQEKEFVKLLNICRTKPQEFLKQYILKYKLPAGYDTSYFRKDGYYKSMINHLKTQKPLLPVKESKTMYDLANCHVKEMVKKQKITHDRWTCKDGYHNESIQIGFSKALDILVDLILDYGVPELSHRKAVFGNYKEIGVSSIPYKGTQNLTVVNFY